MTTILSPELCCTNIKTSLSFYLNILGFKILYQREAEGFAMIERQGARIMLDEIRYTEVKRIWLSAPIEVPFGRGINLEIKTIEIDELYNHCKRSESNIFLPIEDKW